MKKKALGVLALTGTLIVQALVSAGPSAAAEPVVTKTFMRGEGVTAEFHRTDGCIETRIGVFGNVSKVRGAVAPDKLGFVGVTQFDICQHEFLVDGFGQTDTIDQVVKNDLSGGTLRMTLNISNFTAGTVSPMAVNLSFKATSKATTTSVKEVFESNGVRFVSAASTAGRTASATGTIALGADKLVGPGISSASASIDSAVNKEKTIDRPVK